MSDPSILDDNTSAHPLDLLLNAITGSGQYEFGHHDHDHDHDHDPHDPHAHDGLSERDRQNLRGLLGPQHASSSRSTKYGSPANRQTILNTITAHIVQATQQDMSAQSEDDSLSAFSSVDVWHPTSAQKSYGKERRVLNPPPIVRARGPLLPLLTSATLSTLAQLSSSPNTHGDPTPMSSQTHQIPLAPRPRSPSPPPVTGSRSKGRRHEIRRRLREAAVKSGFAATLSMEVNRGLTREREALQDGLAFTGLHVNEAVGKGKEFKLQLILGQPGSDPIPLAPAAAEDEAAITTAEETDLGADIDASTTAALVDHLQAAAEASTEAEDNMVAPDQTSDTKPQQDSEATPIVDTETNETATVPAWASFGSGSLSIVTKPSQKTAKARSMASCMVRDDSFSLWVRIHSQTVRTKYMKLELESGGAGEAPQLTAKTGKWTPFRFEVVRRAAMPPVEVKGRGRARVNSDDKEEILTYGSIVRLVDRQSGVRSEPVKLVKVERNEVVVEDAEGHPLSEFHRVGFLRLVDGEEDFEDGGRWYLSAPGARLGGGELAAQKKVVEVEEDDDEPTADINTPLGGADGEGDEVPVTLEGAEQDVTGTSKRKVEEDTPRRPKKRRRTKRNALAAAIVAEEEEGSQQAVLSWAKAERHEKLQEKEQEQTAKDGEGGKGGKGKTQTVERVEDWMCWTIGGVSHFSYSFFDGLTGCGTVPSVPLDPVPRVLVEPVFHPEQNTMTLIVSDFYYPLDEAHSQPLDVYLGPIGPLRISTWRSTAPKDSKEEHPAVPFEASSPSVSSDVKSAVYSSFPTSIPHTIVVVDMPNPEDIIRSMQDLYIQAKSANAFSQAAAAAVAVPPVENVVNSSDPLSNAAAAGGEGGDTSPSPWLADIGSPGHTLVTGELTIQEALQNAANQHTADMGHGFGDDDIILPDQPDFALDSHFATSGAGDPTHTTDTADHDHQIDPSLALESSGADAVGGSTLQGGEGTGDVVLSQANVKDEDQKGSQSEVIVTRPLIVLEADQPSSKKTEMARLPLLLIRQKDGVGFGVGKSVEAEKYGEENGAPRWGLRLVDA